MKKRILILCISLLILATVCFNISFNLKLEEKSKTSNLTLSTINALAYGEGNDRDDEWWILLSECLGKQGEFECEISTVNKSFEIVTCTNHNEIVIFGTTIRGNYFVGYDYFIDWVEKKCKSTNQRTCCTKKEEGKLVGDLKVN